MCKSTSAIVLVALLLVAGDRSMAGTGCGTSSTLQTNGPNSGTIIGEGSSPQAAEANAAAEMHDALNTLATGGGINCNTCPPDQPACADSYIVQSRYHTYYDIGCMCVYSEIQTPKSPCEWTIHCGPCPL